MYSSKATPPNSAPPWAKHIQTTTVCICVGLCMSADTNGAKTAGSSGAGVTDSCEPSDVELGTELWSSGRIANILNPWNLSSLEGYFIMRDCVRVTYQAEEAGYHLWELSCLSFPSFSAQPPHFPLGFISYVQLAPNKKTQLSLTDLSIIPKKWLFTRECLQEAMVQGKDELL